MLDDLWLKVQARCYSRRWLLIRSPGLLRRSQVPEGGGWLPVQREANGLGGRGGGYLSLAASVAEVLR